MDISQIAHMNIITYARSIKSLVAGPIVVVRRIDEGEDRVIVGLLQVECDFELAFVLDSESQHAKRDPVGSQVIQLVLKELLKAWYIRVQQIILEVHQVVVYYQVIHSHYLILIGQ